MTPGGSYLLISGSFSGQGTLVYDGVPNEGTPKAGCITTDSGEACFLFQAEAPAGYCIGGDSGGPVAVYDPANSRVIPAGIVKARAGSEWAAHTCYLTKVDTIAYIYGNAIIG